MRRAGHESGRTPPRVRVPQQVSHDTLQVAPLYPTERGHQPIGHRRSVVGESPESFARIQLTALNRAHCERKRSAPRRSFEFDVEQSLSTLASRGQTVEMGEQPIVKASETRQVDVRQAELRHACQAEARGLLCVNSRDAIEHDIGHRILFVRWPAHSLNPYMGRVAGFRE
jgi:hypothetical protein